MLAEPQRLLGAFVRREVHDEADDDVARAGHERGAEQHGHARPVGADELLLERLVTPPLTRLRRRVVVEVVQLDRRELEQVEPAGVEVGARVAEQVQECVVGLEQVAGKVREDQAFPAMLRLLKALYDAGITIVPGTDNLAGYMLHHELELYVQAGIPAAEVLRMATLTSALVMGVDKDRGVIAPGKLADMALIDGDPTRNMRDINKITTVIKGGKVYDPAAIEKALGIAPR